MKQNRKTQTFKIRLLSFGELHVLPVIVLKFKAMKRIPAKRNRIQLTNN